MMQLMKSDELTDIFHTLFSLTTSDLNIEIPITIVLLINPPMPLLFSLLLSISLLEYACSPLHLSLKHLITVKKMPKLRVVEAKP